MEKNLEKNKIKKYTSYIPLFHEARVRCGTHGAREKGNPPSSAIPKGISLQKEVREAKNELNLIW